MCKCKENIIYECSLQISALRQSSSFKFYTVGKPTVQMTWLSLGDQSICETETCEYVNTDHATSVLVCLNLTYSCSRAAQQKIVHSIYLLGDLKFQS